MAIAHKLKESGFLVGPVVAPACPLRTPRLRITCGSNFTHESIDRFVNTLKEISLNTPISEVV